IDNVGPVDQVRKLWTVKTKAFSSNCGDQLGARFVGRVVKLLAAAVLTEVLLVLRRQESAVVMIEPPRQPVRARVLEVYNRTLLRIEEPGVKLFTRLMGQSD